MTGKWLNRLFGTENVRGEEGKRRGYVSEFTTFMDQYLKERPEVVRDRSAGFGIYWNRKVDFNAMKVAAKDDEPYDLYGFGFLAWRRRRNRRLAKNAGVGETARTPEDSSGGN